MDVTNWKKFLNVKEMNLPLGQYAITGSGPLGIRNLREIGDVDIIVNSELWDILAEKYGIIDEKGVRKIVFPGGFIEAMCESSFYSQKRDNNAPTVADRIAQAEIIEGLPFESLEHVIYYKRKMGRKKDLQDILIIEAWRKEQQQDQI